MKTINTLNPADLELMESGLFGADFSAGGTHLNKDKVFDYIVEAALILADKIKGQRQQYQKRFLVSSGHFIKSIAVEQIAYFVSEGRYSKIITQSKEKYLLDQSLESLMQKLDPNLFYRVNRQTIVSYSSIQKITVWSKSRVKLELHPDSENDVIVSIDNSSGFKKWLNR